jgi:hypothetical protein
MFNTGLTIMQSPAEGEPSAGGPARFELAVGLTSSWMMSIHRSPYIFHRFNAPVGATLGDVSGGSRDSTALNLSAANVSLIDGALSASGRNRGDEDGAWLINTSVAGPSDTPRWFVSGANVSGQSQFGTTAGYEMWFKTNSTTPKFGALASISQNNQAGNRPQNCNDRNDKVLYMDTAGRLYLKYRVNKGSGATNFVLRSTNTFADMNWHHVMVSWDDAVEGFRLFVDGQQEAADPVIGAWSGISNYDGRFKIGGAQFADSANTICNWITGVNDADDGIITGTTFTGTNYFAAFDGAIDEFLVITNTGGVPMTVTHARQRFNATRCQTTTQFNPNSGDANWYHLTATYNSTTRVGKLFVNGAEQCSATFPTGTSAVPSRPITLGRGFFRQTTQSGGWQGGLGDFKLYDSALSPTDVLKIYDETKNRFPGH